MPRPDQDTLIIAISATVLFDLAEQDEAFQKAVKVDRDEAIRAYKASMRSKEDEPLKPGSAMPLVKAFLALNQAERFGEGADASNAEERPEGASTRGPSPLVEIIVVSQNSPETGLRVLNAIDAHGLPITRSAFLAGDPVAPVLKAFGADLFLSRNEAQVQAVVDQNICAAALLVGAPLDAYVPDERLRLAFDGDAVLFSEDSELHFKTSGLESFQQREVALAATPMDDGPFTNFLRKLGRMQARITPAIEYAPIRIALVTARSAPSHLRVIHTLRSWGVYIDEAYFLGGMDKTPILKAIRPHLFFDDQTMHIAKAAQDVPSAHVLYATNSPLRQLQSKPEHSG